MTLPFEHKQQCIAFVNGVMLAKYELNAQGPAAFDCLSLARKAQRELFGRELPDIYLPDQSVTTFKRAIELGKQETTSTWEVIDKPIHGCIVEMSRGDAPHHIGTWLNISGGGVLHCVDKLGVCFDSLFVLKATGWRRFVYDYPRA